jgi:hypothetical protein
LAILCSPANALWNLNKLTNNSGQLVTISVPFPTGVANGVGNQLATRGDMAVTILGTGAVMFTDQGHNTNCSRPYWGVKITYGDKTWGFFYDGGGLVDMSIAADGTVTFTASSEGSQVVVGNGPPTCRVR